ncbi:MAG: hypothetical protein IKA79_07330 [Lentisphaeria bacterium]|nr:hypothetical protein [Lentisphaeria bacterium]
MPDTGMSPAGAGRKNIFLPLDKSRTMSLERGLLCPECGELLHRSDIEAFTRCPFCDHSFSVDTELEDFILTPMVNEWAKQQQELSAEEDDLLLP